MAQILTSHVPFVEVHFYLCQGTEGNLIAVSFTYSATDDQTRQHRTLKRTNDRVHTVDRRASAHTFSVGSRRKLQIKELSCVSEVLLGIRPE